MSGLEGIYRVGFVLGGLSLLIFFLGHLGLVSTPYLVLSITVAAGLIVFLNQGLINHRVHNPEDRFTLYEKLLVALCLVTIFSVLPLALTPPTVRDELIQHLAVPKLYLNAGRFFEIPWMGFSYLPHNIDLLYFIPLALGSDIVPRLMHLGFAVLTGLLIYLYMAPRSGRTGALFGMVLFLSTPLVINLSRMAYVDLAVAFFSTLALFAVLRWEADFNLKWLLYSAFAMGFALGAKYNSLLSFVLIGAFIVYAYSIRTGRVFTSIGYATIFVAIAVLVLSPWLVRSYIWTGSPAYPLYEASVQAASSGEGIHITGGLSPMGKRLALYGENLFDLLLVPLRIFWEGRDNSIEKFDGVLNPVFLALVPFAFARRGGRELKYLAVFSILFFYMAFLTVDLVSRYLLPAFVPIVVLSAWGLKNLFESKSLRPVGVVLFAVFLVFNITYIKGLYETYRPFRYLTGKETRNDYLSRVLPDYDAVMKANSVLPEDSKVLLIFAGDRGYYWEREVYYSDRLGGQLIFMVKGAADENELRKRFGRFGVTHFFTKDELFEKFVNDNFSDEELRKLSRFFERYVDRVASSNGFSVYSIKRG